jgi:holliday junction DNA helicase RuvB
MEDNVIDMITPDGGNLRLPVAKFTLVGATTKPQNLSVPLKSRFVYKLNLSDYSLSEKEQII